MKSMTKKQKIFFLFQIVCTAAIIPMLFLKMSGNFDDRYGIMVLLLGLSLLCAYFVETNSADPAVFRRRRVSLICSCICLGCWALMLVIGIINP